MLQTVKSLAGFLRNDQDLIIKFQTLIKDLGVGDDKAALFLKGAAKYLISDDYIDKLESWVGYTSIVRQGQPRKSSYSGYLMWLCVLGEINRPLDGTLMSKKPQYPGDVEPQPRRSIIAPDLRPPSAQPTQILISQNADLERDRWYNNMRGAIGHAFNVIKTNEPQRPDQEIYQQIVDMCTEFNQRL